VRNRLRESGPQAVLENLTGVAVIVVGILYVVGILVTSAELWHTGVSVRDTIPLFALDHLLSRGVSLILPLLGVLLALSAIAAGLWISEERVRRSVEPLRDAEEPGLAELGPEGAWEEQIRRRSQGG
jgi:Kef-type K+ transport system membrane component KefB